MKKVLLVEDDAVWAGIFKQYCHQENIEPAVVSSPQEAMDYLDSNEVNLVILDMLLATETGMALLNEIRGYSDLSEVPVVVCTGVDELKADDLEAFGVSEVLHKSSMRPEDFKFVLREYVNE